MPTQAIKRFCGPKKHVSNSQTEDSFTAWESRGDSDTRGPHGKFKWKIKLFRKHVCSPWTAGLTVWNMLMRWPCWAKTHRCDVLNLPSSAHHTGAVCKWQVSLFREPLLPKQKKNSYFMWPAYLCQAGKTTSVCWLGCCPLGHLSKQPARSWCVCMAFTCESHHLIKKMVLWRVQGVVLGKWNTLQ